MVQEEKQQHMLEEAQKNYGNDIKIVSAEKNILHFMTDIQSITYTCHNNGKIDETVRWRRGHKPSAPIVNEDKIAIRKPDNESEQAETVKKKRHKRTKDKIEINADTENTKNQIIKGVNSNKNRENTPLNNKKTATDGSDEKVTFIHETPCPFKRGDSVESRYSGKAYTVLSTLGNTARVIASDPKTEYMEFTICAADLKPSAHKARILEE